MEDILILSEDGKTLLEVKDKSVNFIGSCAFWNCSSLEDIDIPDSVTTIQSCAFTGCTSLKSVHFHHMDIEKCCIDEDIFEGWSENNGYSFIDYDTCTLYIPSGTRWAYRHHPVFSKFKNIVTERQKSKL